MAGQTLAKTQHFVLHSGSSVGTYPQAESGPKTVVLSCTEPSLGALLPKRWAKRSVTRHMLRRQVYAVAQSYAQRLPQAPMVVRLRAAFDPKIFVSAQSEALKAAVRAEITQLFDRACRSTLSPASHAVQAVHMPAAKGVAPDLQSASAEAKP